MKKILGILLVGILCVAGGLEAYALTRPMASGISCQGEDRSGRVDFLYDLTYQDDKGNKVLDQRIFSRAADLIAEAEDFILIDAFLFNDDYDKSGQPYPPLARDLTDLLLAKKEARPDLPVVVITDPINTGYGSYVPDHLQDLQAAGVEVVITDLAKVRDSNPLYSGFYRAYLRWIPQGFGAVLPNLFDGTKPKMTPASYASLLNFKANHRKVLVTEGGGLVASANPHDGSGFHSNIALGVEGDIVQDLLASEQAVLTFSAYPSDGPALAFKVRPQPLEEGVRMTLVTEGKIKEALLETIDQAQAGDRIMVGVFYLADRDLVQAFKEAGARGVRVDMVLDLNKDAFGKKKIGIPNKQVGAELAGQEGIRIRWYETQGEQYHAKFLFHQGPEEGTLIGGSANFTRRNLADLNLETDLVVRGKMDQDVMEDALAYYNRIWENQGGTYTVAYETYAEDKVWKTVIYRMQEGLGLSTF